MRVDPIFRGDRLAAAAITRSSIRKVIRRYGSAPRRRITPISILRRTPYRTCLCVHHPYCQDECRCGVGLAAGSESAGRAGVPEDRAAQGVFGIQAIDTAETR